MVNIFIKSFGCSANLSDGEIIGGLLVKAGHKITDETKADIMIINVCTVKGENTAIKDIKILRKNINYPDKKKYLITGCITPKIISEIEKLIKAVSFLSTHNIIDVVEVIKLIIQDKKIINIEKRTCEKILFPRNKKNSSIGIVQIATGCFNMCSYCSTKLIKGNLFSFSPENIIKDVENFIKEGCKEIWLTAQDTACYGLDINTDITELLEKLCSIKGDFFIRLGMGNPRYFIKFIDKLIPVFKNKKMFKFLHMPVQSGDDVVLKNMNRGYNVKDFEDIVYKFKKEIPEMTISTDIIVGFPEETEEQFKDSFNLIKRIKPAVLNISRFIPRENTLAFDRKLVSSNDQKKRSKALTLLHKKIALEISNSWKGWKGRVLVDERRKDFSVLSRNFAYKPIVIKQDIPLNSYVDVEIIETKTHHFIGKVKNE